MVTLSPYWRATSPRFPQPPGEQWPCPNRQATGPLGANSAQNTIIAVTRASALQKRVTPALDRPSPSSFGSYLRRTAIACRTPRRG